MSGFCLLNVIRLCIDSNTNTWYTECTLKNGRNRRYGSTVRSLGYADVTSRAYGYNRLRLEQWAGGATPVNNHNTALVPLRERTGVLVRVPEARPLMFETNNKVNKTPPDPRNLLPGEVAAYGRKSTKNERSQKSLDDQCSCCRETCVQYSLPLEEDDWFPEAVGAKGEWFWEGRKGNGLEEPEDNQPTRPVLTKVLKAIIAGEKRAIVVWALDRLWRDVSLCQEMIDILFRYDCLLYDYTSGPVNIWTVEGRSSVLQNAVASAAMRQKAAVDSPRGVRKSIEKGVPCIPTNVQGFRSAGKRSGKVVCMHRELALVRRIYNMADVGEGDGPMTTFEIAAKLEKEGRVLFEESDGVSPHGNKRIEGHEGRVYQAALRKILRDTRFIGVQTHNGIRYPCPAFLVEGETAVPVDQFNRIQEKWEANERTSNRAVNARPLASLVRDGRQGLAMTAQEVTQRNGSKVGFWIMCRLHHFGKVDYKVPTIREDTLDAYIADVLAPVILSEINARMQSSQGTCLEKQRLRLEQELREAENYRRVKLPEFSRSNDCSPFLLGQMEKQAVATITRCRKEIAALSSEEVALKKAAPVLADLRNAPESAVRDAIRSLIVWIAVFDDPSEREEHYHPKKGTPLSGSPASRKGGLSYILRAVPHGYHPSSERRSVPGVTTIQVASGDA